MGLIHPLRPNQRLFSLRGRTVIALDTETTGVDLHHGAKPFFVTVAREDGTQQWWEWDVDPLTREPNVPDEDVAEIQALLSPDDPEGEWVVLQNAKFDAVALSTVERFEWPWDRTHDTLLAGHLLASNQPHDLTSMALHYLGVDIQPYEDRLEEAVQECRRYCRSHLPEWRIAKEGLPEMPSAGSKTWKYDSWLPRALGLHLEHAEDHPWFTVLRDYANADSLVTLALWQAMRKELERE